MPALLPAQKVTVEFDQAMEFGSLKTFTLQNGQVHSKNSVAEQRHCPQESGNRHSQKADGKRTHRGHQPARSARELLARLRQPHRGGTLSRRMGRHTARRRPLHRRHADHRYARSAPPRTGLARGRRRGRVGIPTRFRPSSMPWSRSRSTSIRRRRSAMSGAAEFLKARDFLLAHRSDQDFACRHFRWPQMDEFNWALDYFDRIAAGNSQAGAPGARRKRRRDHPELRRSLRNARIAWPVSCAAWASRAAIAFSSCSATKCRSGRRCWPHSSWARW